jgi:hypothetical protein
MLNVMAPISTHLIFEKKIFEKLKIFASILNRKMIKKTKFPVTPRFKRGIQQNL